MNQPDQPARHEALKPCPFCGKARAMRAGREDGWHVTCMDCGADVVRVRLDDVTASWNRRAALADGGQEPCVACAEAGRWVLFEVYKETYRDFNRLLTDLEGRHTCGRAACQSCGTRMDEPAPAIYADDMWVCKKCEDSYLLRQKSAAERGKEGENDVPTR